MEITVSKTSVVDRLAQTVADYVYENGFKRIVLVALAIAAFFGSLGFYKAAGGIQFVLIVISYIGLCMVILLLLLDRRISMPESWRKSELLNSYIRRVYTEQSTSSSLFRYLEWDEEVYINEKGDAELYRWCTIRAGDQPVPAIWSKCIKTTAEQSDRSTTPVVEVSEFHHVDGDGSIVVIPPGKRELGARLLATQAWGEDAGEHIAYAHLDEILPANEIVRVRFHFKWPGFSGYLFATGTERMYWKFGKDVERFTSMLKFSPGCEASSFRVSKFGTPESVTKAKQANGEMWIGFGPHRPPTADKFGFRLDTGA